MTNLVTGVKRHYADGLSVDDRLSIDEKLILMQGREPSPLVKLTWMCDSKLFEFDINLIDNKPAMSLSKLPDASGFIVFESECETDNCVLLDGFGLKRIRLTVPLELTNRDIPKTNQMYFCNVSSHMDGQFGVHAWIEGSGSGGYLQGDWYFELEYHTGQFLWGKEIRS